MKLVVLQSKYVCIKCIYSTHLSIYPLIKNREILRLVSDDIFKGDCYMLQRLESLGSWWVVFAVVRCCLCLNFTKGSCRCAMAARVVCGWSWSGDTGVLIKYNTDTSKTQNIKGDAKKKKTESWEKVNIFCHLFLSTRSLL